jgi:hypothetical protein
MVVRKTSTIKKAPAFEFKPVESLNPNLVMLVYGRSGTGKTAFAATFPKPIAYLDINERGTETIANVEGIEVGHCEEWQDFDNAYWALNQDTNYKTIVVDQITNLQDMAMREILRRQNKKPSEQFTQRNWGQLGGLLKEYILNFKMLASRYNVVLIAHERVFGGGGEEEDNAIEPTIGARVIPSVGSFLDGAVDAIGNTFIRERTVKEGLKKVRHVDYCMRTGPHGSYATKVRRPVSSGPIPDLIVNPTYQKIIDVVRGKSLVKKTVRKE